MQSGESGVSNKKNQMTGVGLYTREQKLRRDQTVWTLVQGVLAPLQFLVFAISAVFIVNFLLNGTGLFAATVSVVMKTGILYTIMVTGAIWEKVVFGRYLFAPAFFWEDAVSMGVIALHSLYLVMLLAGWGTPQDQMWIALAAYTAYVVNAVQFLKKFQQARATSAGAETSYAPNEITLGARP